MTYTVLRSKIIIMNTTDIRRYYRERFGWIFRYTSTNFLYCIAKTLCIIIGLPIYSVMFAVEMILTGVNMIFSWIPILNVVVTVICKSLIFLTDKTFYICILTDIKKFREAMQVQPEYEVSDADVDSSANDIDIQDNADC